MMHPCWYCTDYDTDECNDCAYGDDFVNLFAPNDSDKPENNAKKAYRFITAKLVQELSNR